MVTIKEDDGVITQVAETDVDYGVITASPGYFKDYGLIFYSAFPWPDYDVFPILPGLSWPMTKTPIWKTLIQESASQRETRIGLVTRPRYKWALSFDIIRSKDSYYEYQALVNFINSHYGAVDDFLFWDPTDNFVEGQYIGVGTGIGKSYWLYRTLMTGTSGFVEPITCINNSINNVPAPNAVYINKVALTGLTSGGEPKWTMSDAGVLTFHTAPDNGAEISADFNYFWPVRFLNDEDDIDYAMFQWWEMKKLELISIKE